MNLKKFLESENKFLTGQAALEYFIPLAAIGVLGIVSLSTFFPSVRDTIQGTQLKEGYFQKAANAIIYADGGNTTQPPPEPPPEPPPGNINYTPIPEYGKWYWMGTVPRIGPSYEDPPNYGRTARFFKISTDDQEYSQIQLWLTSGTIGYNSNMITSATDLGTESAWWEYYFKYFAKDGVNPNNGTVLNKWIILGESPYYEKLYLNFSLSGESEFTKINKPASNHTFYIMVIGEDIGDSILRMSWNVAP